LIVERIELHTPEFSEGKKSPHRFLDHASAMKLAFAFGQTKERLIALVTDPSARKSKIDDGDQNKKDEKRARQRQDGFQQCLTATFIDPHARWPRS
jgi:hypothetical protein